MERKKWIWFGALLPAALSLGLGGCGDLSLYGALEGDGGGEFRLSPQAAKVAEDTAFTFEALGGFTPYNIAITGGLTAKDDHTWEFPPTTITGATEDFLIEATDLLGNTATATITVFDPAIQPVLNQQAVTLTVGESFDFTVASGTPPFTWTLDEEVVQADDASTYSHTFSIAGSYTVGVTDALGFYCGATVTVVSSTLTISPTAAWVLVGGTLSFKAYGGDGSYDFSADGGVITDTNPATYTAPGTAGTHTVTLRDGADPPQTVTASVIVVSEVPEPLELQPLSPTVSVGDPFQFIAKGGIPPYVFSTNKPAAGYIDAETGLYTHVLINKNVIVSVRDAGGNLAQTTVKCK